MACTAWTSKTACDGDLCPDLCDGITTTELHALGVPCDEQVAYTTGLATDADGGGGMWVYDDSIARSTANLGTVFDPSVALTVALQGTGSGMGCWVRESSDVLNVKWFGATGDGTTDVASAIQSALDTLEANGGDLFFPAGVYAVGATLIIYTKVILCGEGLSSEIKLANGANCDIVKTVDFATFDGTKAWIVNTTGIPWGYGIKDLKLNGNSANNSSGRGFVGYGKLRFIDNVLILDTPERGYYHQCGNEVGQTDYRDLPEVRINMEVYECGVTVNDHGVVLAGPHDAHYERIVAANNCGDATKYNIYVYGDANVTGGGRVGRIHTYGGAGRGVLVSGSNATLQGEHIIAENGVVFATAGNAVHLLQCNSSNAGVAIDIQSGGNQFAQIRAGTNAVGDDSVVVSGSGNLIDNIRIFAESAGTGIMLDIDGDSNQIGNAYLSGMSGSGGTGIRIGGSGAVDNTTITAAYITGAENSINYDAEGHRNFVKAVTSNTDATKHLIGVDLSDDDRFEISGLGTSFDIPPLPIQSTTPVGNVGTGSDTLISTSLAARSFHRAGIKCNIRAWGTTANNANAKTVTFEFGAANTILTKILTPSIAGTWDMSVDIISSGASAQAYVASVIDGDDGVQDVESGTDTQTDTAAISIRCRGEATANNDIIQSGLVVTWRE